jgi:hypothetical protein
VKECPISDGFNVRNTFCVVDAKRGELYWKDLCASLIETEGQGFNGAATPRAISSNLLTNVDPLCRSTHLCCMSLVHLY